MRSREYRFEGGGTSFYLVVTSGTRQGVCLALPELKWSYTMSDHAPPEAGWLASHGLRSGDAKIVAGWLRAHWPEVSGAQESTEAAPTVLVLRGPGGVGKSRLARRLGDLPGVAVLDAPHPATVESRVLDSLRSAGLVVVVPGEPLPASVRDAWRSVATLHVVSVRCPKRATLPSDDEPEGSIGIAGGPMHDDDDVLGGGLR